MTNETKSAPGASNLSTPELTAVRKFTREIGIDPTTFWRWRQRGWVGEPINIAGRLYLTATQIEEFKQRAAAGEFAVQIKPPIRRV